MDYKIRDCNNCQYLKDKESRICTKTNTKVYHRGRYPILPAYLNDCPLVNYFEKDLSKKIASDFDREMGDNTYV